MLTALASIVLLGVVIFVHELGHFLFAKLMGVKVEKFSLGFGPRLVGFTYGETEYRISAVPLGGYVKMLGEGIEDEEEKPEPKQGEAPPTEVPKRELTEEEKKRSFGNQPVWKRSLIVFFGPAFNLIFACAVLILVFLIGVSVPKAELGNITKDSPAHKAGLMSGDTVTAIDGVAIDSFIDINNKVVDSPGVPLKFTVLRDGKPMDITVTPKLEKWSNLFGEHEGGDIGADLLIHPIIGEVMKGSAAERAGLEKGDRVVMIDEQPIDSWQDMTGIIHGSPGKFLVMTIERGGQTMKKTVVPEAKVMMTDRGEEERGLIGIRYQGNEFIKHFGVVDSIRMGVDRTYALMEISVLAMVKIVQRIIPADTIGGPILIVQLAGQKATEGARSFLEFMAIISVSLGVLNLFPIPLLDGGHLLFFGIEAIRKKPVSDRIMLASQRVGFTLLIMLMVFATYNDVLRLLTGKMLP